MTDYPTGLSEPDSLSGNLPVLGVSELSQMVKKTIETGFARIRVRGEISGFKRAASGHLYLSLKDADAVIDAVCWRGLARNLALSPEDGMEVIATGRLTTYAGRSKYQIVIESLELAGEGALLKQLEERRKRLAAEGLFDAERKRPLPFLPEVIGVVTSPGGAVIRDILHRLAERFPRRVLLWPVLVQGEGAAAQVAAAIAGFNRLESEGAVARPDVIIVARGGGSLEDLAAFNEEIVVRAVAAGEIPLISAVGHETDTTLIDFAADLRAPTPTAAAELAVPVRAELLIDILDYARRLVAAAGRTLEERRVRVEGLGRGLPDPERLLLEKAQRLDERTERLENAVDSLTQGRRALLAELAARLPHPRQQFALATQDLGAQTGRLAALRARLIELPQQAFDRLDAGRRLGLTIQRLLGDAGRSLGELARLIESTSYQKVLARGFAVVRSPQGLILESATVRPGLLLDLEFQDGHATAIGGDAQSPGVRPTRQRSGKSKPIASKDDDPQGELL